MPKYLKFIAVVILTIFSHDVNSQTNWIDNFTDSNFTANPKWQGDTANFKINSQKQLQLNAPAITSSSSLYTSSKSAINASWEFLIRLDFNPSSSNYAQVFLMSSSQNFSAPLSAYYLQFGGNTSDNLFLYKRQGNQDAIVAQSANGLLNKNTITFRVKVTRDSLHQWTILADTLGGTSFTQLAAGFDSTLTSSYFFGLNCIYTSTRSTKFFLDDISVNGQIFVDTQKPEIASSDIIGMNKIALMFSEAVDSTSAAKLLNYNLNALNNTLASAIWKPSSPNQVELVCQNPFQNLETFSLHIEEIIDRFGNDMVDTTVYFTVNRPSYRSVVFNEIMADPSPTVGLPDAEYIELYNATSANLELKNWSLVNDADTVILGEYTLPPSGYVLLVNSSISDYDSLPNLKIPAGSGWLKNDGEQLFLLDENKQVIDAFGYNSVMYGNTAKQDGGWSLEQINPNLECSENSNWCASAATLGGTPAKKNLPERSLNTENTAFRYVVWRDEFHVSLAFNHSLSPTKIPTITSSNTIDSLLFSPANSTQLDLVFTNPIGQQNVTIYLEEGVSCIGNVLADTITFSFPVAMNQGEIVLNELLFNPSATSTDFIEIWNVSDKTFLLNNLRLANLDEVGGVKTAFEITQDPILLPPKHIMVFSEDENMICKDYDCSKPKHFFNVASMPSMPDNEGNVALIEKDLTVLESVNYSSDWHHPLISNAEGVSLERIHPSQKCTEQSSWHSAASTVNFATPGKTNSQFSGAAGSTGSILLNTNTLSPNNDGQNDVLLISYDLPPESALSLTVFGLNGVRITTIADNIITEIEGQILWNGTGENGQIPVTGIYILLAEWFTPSGEKGIQKLNFAISN